MKCWPKDTRYSLTDDGFVIGLSGNALVGRPNENGYLRVLVKTASGFKDAYVHQMVCEAFHGPKPTADHQVNHRNRDRSDNRPENLEWVRSAENLSHRVLAHGEGHGSAKLTDEQVLAIKSLSSSGQGPSQIARSTGHNRRTISDICNGKTWRHLNV